MIILGDSLEKLKELEPNSVDSVVTDPPYGWRFMGKAWDAPDIKAVFTRDKTLPTDDKTTLGMAAGKYDNSLSANQSFQLWTEQWAKEVIRVLKPGGHALIFCGPRTYHRMASGVEDAGFEIRDQLQWLFGSGFPKSHDISKAIDKAAGAERPRVPIVDVSTGKVKSPDIDGEMFKPGKEFTTYSSEPVTTEASQWVGWGTALKPANEPIVLARKPLSEKTVALNVLKWGTGALNIDGSRIDGKPRTTHVDGNHKGKQELGSIAFGAGLKDGHTSGVPQGRWPANLLLDEEAAEMLDASSFHWSNGVGPSRFFYCAKASKRERNAGLDDMPDTYPMPDSLTAGIERKNGKRETSRKSKSAIKNNHPTVKPIKLMEYLIRLITPPNGLVLDPFMGSGTTGVAAEKLGFRFIGIELNKEYVDIAERRIGVASKCGT